LVRGARAIGPEPDIIRPSRKPHPVSLSFPILPDVFAHSGAFEPLDVKLPGAMSRFFHRAIAIAKALCGKAETGTIQSIVRLSDLN
jgi:hypothetical protein